MGVEVIYSDEEIEVIHRSGDSGSTLIAFSAIIHRDNEKWYWAASPAEKLDLNCICFSPKRKNYFPARNVQAAFEAAKPFLSGVRVMYGASMGGYAAIKFSHLFEAYAVLSFSPQFSVSPEDVPYDPARHAYYSDSINRGMRITSGDAGGILVIVGDPKHTIDRKHAEAILTALADRDVHYIPMRYCGHDTITVMAQTRSFEPVYKSILEGKVKSVARILSDAKKRSPAYLLNLARYVCRSRRVELASKIWDQARLLGASSHVVASVEAAEYLAAGHKELAFSAAERVLREVDERSDADAVATAGYVFEKLGEPDKAISAYEISVQLAPRIVKYTMKLTSLLNEVQRFEESAAHAQRVLELVPNDAHLLGRLAWTQLALRDYPAAARTFVKALNVDPSVGHLTEGLRRAQKHL